MVKKIFMTGASGITGREVVKRLKDNYRLTLLVPPDELPVGFGGLNVVRGDVTRPLGLRGLINGHDTLIHMAGAHGHHGWKDCLSINVDGSRNIIRKAVKAGVIRFIYLSSVAVYGRVPGIRITEEQSLKKIRDPYGDTIIEAEKIIRKYAGRNRVDLTVLRPTAIYDEGEENFMADLVRNIRSGKFRLVGDGSHPVDLIHASDVAEAVYLTLLRPESVGQTYNIVNEKNPSWNRFLEETCQELNLPFTARAIPYRLALRWAGLKELLSAFSNKPPGFSRSDVRQFGRNYDYSMEKARKELGFEPSVDLMEGMRNCVRKLRGSPREKDPEV